MGAPHSVLELGQRFEYFPNFYYFMKNVYYTDSLGFERDNE